MVTRVGSSLPWVRTLRLVCGLLLSSGCVTVPVVPVNSHLRALDDSALGTPYEKSQREWVAVLQEARARGELETVIEGNQWVFAGGIKGGDYVDIEWHIKPGGDVVTIGHLRQELVPGGTIEQQVAALGLKPWEGRNDEVARGTMLRNYEPRSLQQQAGLAAEEPYEATGGSDASTFPRVLLLTEQGRVVRVVLLNEWLNCGSYDEYQEEKVHGFSRSPSSAPELVFKDPVRIAWDLAHARQGREAAEASRKYEEGKQQERAEAAKKLEAEMKQVRALIAAGDLEAVRREWPGFEATCQGVRSADHDQFLTVQPAIVQLEKGVAGLLAASAQQHQQAGLDGLALEELLEGLDLSRTDPGHRSLLEALEDPGVTMLGRAQKLAAGLTLRLTPAVEGPLAGLPGWYGRSATDRILENLEKLPAAARSASVPTVQASAGPFQGRLTASIVREPRTNKYWGLTPMVTPRTTEAWKEEIEEAEDWVHTLTPTAAPIEPESLATDYQTGQENVVAGTGREAHVIGVRSVTVESWSHKDRMAKRAARAAAHGDDGHGLELAKAAVERIRARGPMKEMSNGRMEWKYEAECQVWTSNLSRTLTLEQVSVTQVLSDAPPKGCFEKADPKHDVTGEDNRLSEADAMKKVVAGADREIPKLLEAPLKAIVAERIKARIDKLRRAGMKPSELEREAESLRRLFLEGSPSRCGFSFASFG